MNQTDQQIETTAAEQTIPVSGDSNALESTPPDARVEAAFEKAVSSEYQGTAGQEEPVPELPPMGGPMGRMIHEQVPYAALKSPHCSV